MSIFNAMISSTVYSKTFYHLVNV